MIKNYDMCPGFPFMKMKKIDPQNITKRFPSFVIKQILGHISKL